MPYRLTMLISLTLQVLSLWLSIDFVRQRRLGRPWLFVSAAIFVMALSTVGEILSGNFGDAASKAGLSAETVEFAVSFLLALGFFLTGRWFALKERLRERIRLIHDVEGALVGVLDEDRILETVCDILAQAQGYRLAWIGRGETDGTVSILHVSGDAPSCFREVSFRWDGTPEGEHPAGFALRGNAPCIVNDLLEDPRFSRFREICRENGFRSCAALPIAVERGGRLVLSIHARAASAFDPVETDLILAMANRVAAALESAGHHERLRCAKVSYDEILRVQRDGVILVRGEMIVRANPAAVDMLGSGDPSAIVGEDPGILLDPNGDLRVMDFLRAGCPGKGSSTTEIAVRRKDGNVFPAEISVAWAERPDGGGEWVPTLRGPLGMIVIRDITARKAVLDELQKERDFSAKILDIAGILVVQLSRELTIELVNRQFEEVTGFASGEVVGREFAEVLVPEGGRPACRKGFRDAFNGRVPPTFEVPVRAKNGEERLVAWNNAVLQGPDGESVSLITSGTDVTEARRLEHQIIEMQKMEAVGTLAGGVAHDFNNILTGILGHLEMARRAVPVGPSIEEAIRLSERAAHLVRQLLDFSRRSHMIRRAVDPAQIIGEVVCLFSQTIDRRIGVETEISPTVWTAEADPTQVHQVLMNLCVNARDAVLECLEGDDGIRPADGYRIRIGAGNATVGEDYCRLYPYARPGEFVVLEIADNGSGMDEATQRRVFEPFFTTKRLGRGTGLGLSTVYGIVKQHAGWINLESRLGKGTTFRVYLPRSEGEAEEEMIVAPEFPVPCAGSETILLVDDEEMIRLLGRQILEIHGYTVLTAADGREAVDVYLAEQERIDLVILDLTMPYLSGAEVLSHIRKLNPRASVVLSSGHLSDIALTSCAHVAADAYLQKPYRAAEMVRTVRELLDRPAGPHPSAFPPS